MELSLMEKFVDPALFDSLTMGEKATGALITTCMGMGITFIVLLLLWAVIAIMSNAIAVTEKKVVKTESTNMMETIIDDSQTETVNDAELVAVISAAIAAYEGSTSLAASNLVVRKLTRIGGNAWGNAGMADCVESRKIY